MGKLIETIPTEVTEAVAESLRLFRQAHFRQPGNRHGASQPLPSLLERCEQYIAAERQPRKEHIRLIHHFACTGGTLITKCLACSPNVHVLSEVDPLSPMAPANGKFNPTDLIQLVQHGNRGTSVEEKLALFQATFGLLYNSSAAKGLRMLVRDHTHSHFCTGSEIESRPTLGRILSDQYQAQSIITVRHSLDSWLSLVKNGWVSFQPATLEEYARRYQAFLDINPNVRIFKYEDFVASPAGVLRELCEALDLPFPADFQLLFTAHSFSGDSGRKGEVIKPRERRPIANDLVAQVQDSLAFRSLCRQLNYEI